MKKSILLYIVLVLSMAQGMAQTPSQALRQLQDRLMAMGAYKISVEVQTVYKSGQFSPAVSATLTVQGDKFALDSPIQTIQYDGQTLYTLDKQNNEVNIETMAKSNNPLMNPSLLLQFKETDFQQTESAGKLILTSKLPKLPFKVMTMTFNGQNLNKIELSDLTHDNQIKSMIFKVGQPTGATSIDKNTFVFDKKAHPEVDIVDFRK